MTLRTLPEAKTFPRPQNFQWDAPSDVLAKWNETPLAASSDDDSTITMFEVIGEDFWTGGGVTAKRVSAALRSIGEREVRVRLNSPGGDLFEGIAIYNLLRKHNAKVTVEVMGWAASAASIIAMAGDEIKMGLGTFMMVHNCWGIVVGNRHDMREASDMLDEFDSGIVDIYEARTGADRDEIVKLMDAETFMGPTTAVELGFADMLDEGMDMPTEDPENTSHHDIQAKRHLDAILAKSGIPRSERRRMIKSATGDKQDAVPAVTQNADLDPTALRQLIETIKS